MKIWQPHTLENHRSYRACLGPLTLWVRREDDELHVASVRDTATMDTGVEEPLAAMEPDNDVTLTWTRYILAADSQQVQLVPQMPDRSLVARPESVVELPAGRRATFYVSIPICVGIQELSSPVVLLEAYPTVVLSNIWFGDPMEGELCYSLTTRARRSDADSHPRPHRALCTFEVRNESEIPLKVQRLRVEARNLALYDDGERLWTNHVVARFKSELQGTQLQVMPQAPGPAMTCLRPASTPQRGSALGRVFGIFRQEGAILG